MRAIAVVLIATGLVGCGTRAHVFESVDSAGPDAGFDAGLPGDAGPPEAGDAGSPTGCRTDLLGPDGEYGGSAREFRAEDGRLLRTTLDLEVFEGGPDAWVEILAWDDAGRATHARWVEDRFTLPIVFREEERTYDSLGRITDLTVTLEGAEPVVSRYLYEDGLLRSVELLTSAGWQPTSTFVVDLPNRRLEADWRGEAYTVEWDEAGWVVRYTETVETGPPLTSFCTATEIDRDADGNVLNERIHPCEVAAGAITIEYVYEETAETRRLDRLDYRLGTLSSRIVQYLDEDRVETTTARRMNVDSPIVFGDREIHRSTGCGSEIERTASSFVGYQAGPQHEFFLAAPIDSPFGMAGPRDSGFGAALRR